MFKTKDRDWPNGYKSKTPIYAAYKKSTSNLETHTDSKSGARKNISRKWRPKESGSSNTHIR